MAKDNRVNAYVERINKITNTVKQDNKMDDQSIQDFKDQVRTLIDDLATEMEGIPEYVSDKYGVGHVENEDFFEEVSDEDANEAYEAYDYFTDAASDTSAIRTWYKQAIEVLNSFPF